MSAPVKVGETVTVWQPGNELVVARVIELYLLHVNPVDRTATPHMVVTTRDHARVYERLCDEGRLWIRGAHNQETPEGAALLTVRALNP